MAAWSHGRMAAWPRRVYGFTMLFFVFFLFFASRAYSSMSGGGTDARPAPQRPSPLQAASFSSGTQLDDTQLARVLRLSAKQGYERIDLCFRDSGTTIALRLNSGCRRKKRTVGTDACNSVADVDVVEISAGKRGGRGAAKGVMDEKERAAIATRFFYCLRIAAMAVSRGVFIEQGVLGASANQEWADKLLKQGIVVRYTQRGQKSGLLSTLGSQFGPTMLNTAGCGTGR